MLEVKAVRFCVQFPTCSLSIGSDDVLHIFNVLAESETQAYHLNVRQGMSLNANLKTRTGLQNENRYRSNRTRLRLTIPAGLRHQGRPTTLPLDRAHVLANIRSLLEPTNNLQHMRFN